jgi:hypothetical protein
VIFFALKKRQTDLFLNTIKLSKNTNIFQRSKKKKKKNERKYIDHRGK